MVYEKLLDIADMNNVYVVENANFKSDTDGLINGDVIGLNKRMRTSRQRACVLAEELGHYYTTIGDILDLSKAENRKQERRARIWAYDRLIGLKKLAKTYALGYENYYEVAEYLDVTEDFLRDAVQYYKERYGLD